jgi:hypothetical protein
VNASVPAGVLLLVAVSARAQTVPPPLTSNRPGIGDSEALVPPRTIQLEIGARGQGGSPDDDRRWRPAWGELTVRFGVVPRIEICGGWDGLSLERVAIEGRVRSDAGGSDLRVGTKLAVLSEDRHRVTLTVAPAWSFPVGADPFTTGSHNGSLRVMLARSLPRDWSVSGNLLFTRTTDAAGRHWATGTMASMTRALTPTVSAFAEISGVLLPVRPDAWTMDTGLAWVASPDLQVDVSAGHTFLNRGDAWFVSAGLTIRRRP